MELENDDHYDQVCAKHVVIPTVDLNLENILNKPIEIKIKILIRCPNQFSAPGFFNSDIGKEICERIKREYPTSTCSNFIRLNVVEGKNELIGYRYTLTNVWLNSPASFAVQSKEGTFSIKSFIMDRKVVEVGGVADFSREGLRSKYERILAPFFDNFIVRCHENSGPAFRRAQIVMGAIPKLMKNVSRIFVKDVVIDLVWPMNISKEVEYGLIVVDKYTTYKSPLRFCYDVISRYKDGEIVNFSTFLINSKRSLNATNNAPKKHKKH